MTQKRKLFYKVLSGLFQHHWIGSIHIRAPSLSYTHADIKSCIAPVTPAHIPSFFLPYQICQTQSEISEVRRGESWAPSTTQKSSCLWQRSTESRKKLSTCDGVGKCKDKLKVGKARVPNTMEVWCYGDRHWTTTKRRESGLRLFDSHLQYSIIEHSLPGPLRSW